MASAKLTDKQKTKLSKLQSQFKEAVKERDFEQAKSVTTEIQDILRPAGNETRLMQFKSKLYELGMNSGNLDTAIAGFIGVRKKVSDTTKLYIEATALLAICFIRKKELNIAKPYIVQSFDCDKNISSDEKRSEFKAALAKKFEKEVVSAGLPAGEIKDLINS